jgi:tetratricopeptide (TPR) repeat protein
MTTSGSLEFINRGAELAFLTNCLQRPKDAPTLIVIRSPSGFGKSRLTDQLIAQSDVTKSTSIVVDPNIRGRTGSTRVHDGFFIQRCAEELSRIAQLNQPWSTLASFIKERRWKTVAEKNRIESIAELPGLRQGYRVAFDYTARLFGFGRFSASQLLASDQSDAVRICSEYVEHILTTNTIVLVVRETQHCDLHTLRALLRMNQMPDGADLIVEYTSDTGRFEPEHQKMFMRTAETHGNFHILELFRLERNHLEYLIRKNIKADFHLTSDFYASWDGNLCSVIELKFQVGIGRQITNAAQIENMIGDYGRTLQAHIETLTSLQMLILAVAVSHVESIERWMLLRIVGTVGTSVTSHALDRELGELIDVHDFLIQRGSAIAIRNESIANLLRDSKTLRPLLALSEKSLRDCYLQIIERGAYAGTGLAIAIRQAFKLCARTKDAAGLLHVIETLSKQIELSQDQSMYVEVVAGAIAANPELFAQNHDDLLTWAASLAYEVGDWRRSADLLAAKLDQNCFSLSMRACALQEIGGHDEALRLVTKIRTLALNSDELLSADLIEAIIVGCRGQQDEAKSRLNAIIENPANKNSPLVGYAYRFFEVIEGYVECIDKLRASVQLFHHVGFAKSKAYSQLPTAVLMARMGDIEGARNLIDEAQVQLAEEVRDQHMILNNRAAIELLDESPNFVACREMLSEALRYVRDDYSELTILINLGLAHWGKSEMDPAIDCIEKALAILKRHDFADEDIYWPVCFNAGQILAACNRLDQRDEVMRFPYKNGRPASVNRNYWAYRYGEASELAKEYRFLASKPRHPLYLSHWMIDVEGLNLLKRVRLR